MKIYGIIAEYNPLHFGHIKQMEYIKKVLGAEKIIVFLSGNFTQRGEPAILNKFTRAKHAVILGADMVIEIPTVFATANAETFAFGTTRLIDFLDIIDGLCFGVESGTKENYVELATAMNNESKQFKKILRENLEKGYSLCKSKFETIKTLGGEYDENLISSPNNILGLEYTKALLKLKSKTEIFPILRTGDHNDKKLKEKITSAKSIRENLKTGKTKKLKKVLPTEVYADLKDYPFEFEKMILTTALTTSAENMAKIPDCTEGLENRIKALLKDNKTLSALLSKTTTKRYTESRINRILTCNLLGITRELTADCLDDMLYAKILAVKNDSIDLIQEITKNSDIPLLTRKSDTAKLNKIAKQCYNVDVLANELYNLAKNEKTNENQMLIIK